MVHHLGVLQRLLPDPMDDAEVNASSAIERRRDQQGDGIAVARVCFQRRLRFGTGTYVTPSVSAITSRISSQTGQRVAAACETGDQRPDAVRSTGSDRRLQVKSAYAPNRLRQASLSR